MVTIEYEKYGIANDSGLKNRKFTLKGENTEEDG